MIFLLWLSLLIPNASFAQDCLEPESIGWQRVRTIHRSEPGFTEGLVHRSGTLYESTGRYGESRVNRIDLQTGEVKAAARLDDSYFGEGLDLWQGGFAMLTWKENTLLLWNRGLGAAATEQAYPWEGWGLTHSPTQWIASDGSGILRFLNPRTFQLERELTVRNGSENPGRLNELEWVNGQIYANLYPSDRIARVNPETGCVSGILDLSRLRALLPEAERKRIAADPNAVLNGIAWDPSRDVLYVAGKTWPYLFEIKLR